MKFTDKKLAEQGQGQWFVTIDGEQWQEILKKAKRSLEENLEIPGFRKGKAPKTEVAKYMTPAKIYNEAFRMAVSPAFDFALEQKSAIEPMNPPTPSPFKVNDEAIEISFTFDLRPEIKLGAYKGLNDIEKEKVSVTDKEVEDILANYQQRFAMEIPKDKDAKIEKGDIVTFNFKGYVNDEAFAGGEANDYKLEIGSNQFVPGFEDSMIGLTFGADQPIMVTFPENYTEGLSGKEAKFVLNIKEIAKKELPAIDDELAKDMNLPNVETLAQLKEQIKKDALAQKEANAKNLFVDKVIKEVIEKSEIDLPKSLIDQEIKHLKSDFEQQVMQQGLSLKDYKKATGLTDAQIEADLADDAKLRLQTYLVTAEIQKNEKFEATDKDVEAKLESFSSQFGLPVEQLKTILPVDQLKAEIANDKLIDFLYENNGK